MKIKLPEEFTGRMRDMLGSEYNNFLESYESTRNNALRICELKTSLDKFQAQAPFYMEPVSWVKNGFFYKKEDGVSTHPYYRAGVYYLTEGSAMTPADRLPIQKGDKVLDLCAAPGGKAFAAACKLADSGLLVANEVSKERSKALVYNLESIGISNFIITNNQPTELEEKFPAFFDKILVDAPCSGEGMFRKNPDAAAAWSLSKVQKLAALQKSILKSAVHMLAPGGMLMYSTCTFSPEENEQNLSWLLNEYPDLQIMDIEDYAGFDHGHPEWANGDERVKKAVRIWPHKMDGEGHFLALVRKEDRSEGITDSKNKANNKTCKNRLKKEETKILSDFFLHIKKEIPFERIRSCTGHVFLEPELEIDTGKLHVLRKGLYLGELKKDRFEPSQSLAFYLSGSTFDRVYDLKSDPEGVSRYLKGETLILNDSQENGWILVCYDGFSLGFGKISGNKIKNKLLYSRMVL